MDEDNHFLIRNGLHVTAPSLRLVKGLGHIKPPSMMMQCKSQFSLLDQAPINFGRSPNRAIKPKTRMATSTNTTATDAMTGV